MSGNGSTSYTGDQKKVFDWNWNWGGSGGLALRTTTNSPITHSQNASAHQSFARDFSTVYFPRISVSISEDITGTKALETPIEASMSHRARISESQNTRSQSTSSSLTFSDRRTVLGENKTSSQFVNFQVNDTISLTRTSRLKANMSAQASRQTSDNESGIWQTSSSGSIGYNVFNFMSVPNLGLSTAVRFSSNTLIPISLQAPSTATDSEVSWNRSWKLSLNYSLGKFSSDLSFNASLSASAPMSNSVNFSVRRNF
jgi:hypothetical protein